MAEQSRGLYRLLGSKTAEEIERSLNFILMQIADRLDQLEGLRGTPKFYKSAFDFSTSAGLTVGNVLKATTTGKAEISAVDVSEVTNAAPTISSGLSAQIDVERSLVSLIDSQNDYVVHQFPTQWLEYNSEVFMFTTNESFQELTTVGGDVKGPGSSVDSDIAEWDGTTGKQIKDGGLTHAGVLAASVHRVAEDAVNGIIEGNGAGGYSAASTMSGNYLVKVYDENNVMIHEYPVDWTMYNSEVFGFPANGVDLPTMDTRSNMGLSIGSDVQAWDSALDDLSNDKISGLTLMGVYDADSEMIHQYPLEWQMDNSEVFGFYANGKDMPTFMQYVENNGYVGINDADLTRTALSGDEIIGFTALTATRNYQFSSEDITCLGRRWTIKDESGSAGTYAITVSTEGAETIDGAATISINSNYGSVTLYSNGSNLFII
jgi:hypothetical protein